jgi:hypothetical protein
MQRSSRARLRALLLVAVVVGLVLLPAATASAHGDGHIGDLEYTIGFGTEPAYAGQPNSVELLLVHDGQPVTDLRAGEVQVEVSFGDASTTFDMEPNFALDEFGDPGDYRAWFVPSEAGPYTFHFTGEVDGEEFDVEMSSGADTFSEVLPLADSMFPPVNVPSTDQLVARIEQESQRTQAAQDAADAANDEASSAKTTATIAVILGALGVIAGIAGIAVGRHRA